MSEMIEVVELAKTFGDLVAVDAASFAVKEGEIFGFLGPNGAGKSTTIKILATLLAPSGGRASIAGFDVAKQPLKVRESIGLIFQDPSVDDRLSAYENLYIHALLYDLTRAELQERAKALLEMVDLTDRKDSLVRTFSGGMRRRLEIARGLLHRPKVLFLDEPTVGLDPQTRNSIWEHVKKLRDAHGVTVFMTTHYLDEAENCDRIAIIDHGKVVALGTPEELKRRVGGDVISIGTQDAALADKVAAKYEVEAIHSEGAVRFQVDNGASFVPRLIADFPSEVQTVSVARPTLDDVFLKLTGRAIREEEGTAKDQLRMRMRAFQGGGRRR